MFLAFLLVLFLAVAPPARAELPPYKPEMLLPDPNTPKAQKLPPIYRGPFEFDTAEYVDGEALKIIEGTNFGFELQDIIMPVHDGQEEEISTPYYNALATFSDNAQLMQLPQEVRSKMINWDPINENINSTVFCARLKNQSKYSTDESQRDISSTGTQLSSNEEGTQQLYQNIRALNSVWGLHTFESITPGFYDFNLPPEINGIKDASGYCMAKIPSTPFTETDNPVTQLASWTSGSIPVVGYVYETIMKVVTWFNEATGKYEQKEEHEKFIPKYQVNLTGANVRSHNQQLGQLGDSTREEVDGSKIPWVKDLAKTRGLTFNFLPEHLADDPAQKDPANRAALSEFDYVVTGLTVGNHPGAGKNVFGQEKNYKAPALALNNAKYRSKQMACTSVPQEVIDAQQVFLSDPNKLVPPVAAAGNNTNVLAGAVNINDAIPINDLCGPAVSPTPAAACPIEKIANMGAGSASCKLTDFTTAKFNTVVSNASSSFNPSVNTPNGFPELAQKVLNAAADQYGVPASVLLGTMIDEGAFFLYPEWVWKNDEAVKEFSDCTNPNPMPPCDATAAGGQGSFGFLASEWQKENVQGAIFEAFPDRPKENVTSCNFVDAAYAAAKVLSQSGHYFVDEPPLNTPLPDSCNGQTVSHERNPLTSCSQWDASRVALARMQYAERACYPSVDVLVNTYKTFTSGAH